MVLSITAHGVLFNKMAKAKRVSPQTQHAGERKLKLAYTHQVYSWYPFFLVGSAECITTK